MEEKQNIVVPKDFLDHLSQTSPSKWKLIVHPEQYIKDAIVTLEKQLEGTKTENRRKKIQLRIDSWKKELQIIEEKSNENKESTSKDSQKENT